MVLQDGQADRRRSAARDTAALRPRTSWRRSGRIGEGDDLLLLDWRESEIQASVVRRAPARHLNVIAQGGEMKTQVDRTSELVPRIDADHGLLAHDRRAVLPTPLIFRLDLGKVGVLLAAKFSGWPGEHMLQCVQITALTMPVHLGPGPIDPAMVRMIGNPVVGEHFTMETIERMDVVGSFHSILAGARLKAFAEPWRLVYELIVVVQHRLITVPDLHGARIAELAHGERAGCAMSWAHGNAYDTSGEANRDQKECSHHQGSWEMLRRRPAD